jgi:hypothetical protein
MPHPQTSECLKPQVNPAYGFIVQKKDIIRMDTRHEKNCRIQIRIAPIRISTGMVFYAVEVYDKKARAES